MLVAMDVPKYKIIKKLDSGGMAEVFQAEVETIKGFKKTVAIKRIRPNLIDDQKFVQMFMDEAKLSLFLQHANIATVFDVGTSGDHFFIVMEYVEGLNLRSILEHSTTQALPVPLAIFIVNNVCEALDYAHNLHDPSSGRHLNIVHRDISPPNILISQQGEIKLVDFGLAKAASQKEESDPGVIKGKFSYLSPEAAKGLVVDHRTDIFAAGIILWELIAGRRLYHGETDYDTVMMVREALVPPLSGPGVGPELMRIIKKTLARDPENRYQRAGDLSEDLTKYLFQQGTAVTKKDLASLVTTALKNKKYKEPSALISRDSFLTTLIQDELDQLISLGKNTDTADDIGAAPLSLDSLEYSVETTGKPVFATDEDDASPAAVVSTQEKSEPHESGQLSVMRPHTSQPISFVRQGTQETETGSGLKIAILVSLVAAAGFAAWFFLLR